MRCLPGAGVYAGLVSAHEYPEDEFDELGKDAPGGVHREKPSQWKSVLPFLVVLVLAPLLAWGAATFYAGQRDTTPTTSTTTAAVSTQTTTAAEQPTQAATSEASATPTSTEDSADSTVDPDFTKAQVMVLNGTEVNGLAAEAADRLKGIGFLNMDTDNADGWLGDKSIVYFRAGHDKAAKEVAKELKIDAQQENTDAVGDKDVIVVLRDDFQR